MSASFIAIAVLAAVLIINWRLVLIVLSACLIALVVMGIGVADGEASAQRSEPLPTSAPAEPGQPLPAEVAPATR
ncbi:hypothetical protein BJF78_13260 [Pseudonocardia sp. CNS-139]|nr:hypothetical protein BJF78_13260 [Pseudonocardia sp. CNS-139]